MKLLLFINIVIIVVIIKSENIKIDEIEISLEEIKSISQTFLDIPLIQEIQFCFCNSSEKIKYFDLLIRNTSFNKMIGLNFLDNEFEMNKFIESNDTLKNTGFFLDMTCSQGISFLTKSSKRQLFDENHVWLIWKNSNSSEVIRQLNLSISSQVITLDPVIDNSTIVEIKINDVYKVHRTTTIRNKNIAVWSSENGLVMTSKRPSRNNFGGFKMNAIHAVIDFNDTIEKFVDRFYYPDTAPTPRLTIRWFLDIANIYNFSYNYSFVRTWGHMNATTGKWSGMLGALQRGDVELSFSVIHIRQDRMNAGNFITTFFQTKMVFIFLQQAVFGTPTAIITPLSFDSWICLIAALPIFALVARIFSKFEPSEDIDSWSAILEFIVGNVTQQGPNDNMKLISSRVMAFCLFALSIFVNIYYSAAILNGLLSPAPKLINTVNKLLDSKMSVAISDIAYMKDFSTIGVYGPMTASRRKLFKKLEEEKSMFITLKEGVDKVKKQPFALMADYMLAFPEIKRTYDVSEICNMDLIVNKVPKINLGLMMKEKSPYRDIFAQKLLWQEEVGLKQRNYNQWIESRPQCTAGQQTVSIGLVALSLPFYGLIIFLFVSLAILAAESLLKILN